MKISSIIITRDEEENIVDCINSLTWTDEVIVVDNNSKDKTPFLAQSRGVKVFSIESLDFSYLRNLGKEKAQGEWLFYIDADERVTPDLIKEVKLNVKNSKYAAFEVTRQNYFLGALWPKKEKMVRLMKKEALIGWQGSLHETPIITGKIGNLSGLLLHFAHQDLSKMIAKTNGWSEIEAKLRYQNGHPAMVGWRFFRVIATTFWRYYIREGGWKTGTVGLIESIYQAFSMFITYAKLWELQNKNNIKLRHE